MNMMPAQTNDTATALDQLVNRDEVLQICYWYEGEGFGKVFNAAALVTFLKCDTQAAEVALRELVMQGHMEAAAEPASGYRFTAKGRQTGGRLFADGFEDYQKAGHGECAAGCCEEDDHSQCGDDCPLH